MNVRLYPRPGMRSCLLALAFLAVPPGVFSQSAAPATGSAPEPPAKSAPNPEKTSSKRDSRKAEQAYLAGAAMMDHNDLEHAEQQFRRAVELNPTRPEYSQALTHARNLHVAALLQEASKARLANDLGRSASLLEQARTLDPENPLVIQHAEAAADLLTRITPQGISDRSPWTPDLPRFSGPVQLVPTPANHDFNLHADLQNVVLQVAQAYGIGVIFDASAPHQDLRFALDSAPYTQTMPILLRMAHLLSVPIDSRTILVYKDTQENRAKFERQLEESVFVPGSTNEQLTELANIVKNVFDVKQISVVNNSGTMLIRAPEATLKVVNYTLADLIDGGSQVMLELKLYTIDKSRTRNTGAGLPQQFGAFSVAAEAQSLVSANQSVVDQAVSSGALVLTGNSATDLITEALFLVASGIASSTQVSGLLGLVGGGLTSLGIYEGANATFNLSVNSSDVRSVENMQVRVGDRQTTTMRVGSKYPITTSTYATGGSSSTSSSLAGVTINGVSAASLLAQYLGTSGTTTTTPQIQYEDLGLTLKTTPMVQKSGMIAIHVDLKLESLTGQSLDDIPILTSRAFTSDVTVADGTSAVILSQMSKTEAGSLNGIPGLSDLPGFQDATQRIGEQDSSELVLSITPHIVRRRSNVLASPRIAFTPSVPQEY